MKDTQFMTAKEKEIVLSQWKIFLRKLAKLEVYVARKRTDYGEYPSALEKAFTESLYQHLSQHYDFIAHFNRLGFLSARFEDAATTSETLRRMKQCPISSEYLDINQAMLAELETNTGLAIKYRL